MHIIFDNLTAILIGGIVLLILLAVQVRSSEINLEQTSMYTAKQLSLDFAEWLEDDLVTLGTNFDSTDARFTLPTNASGNTTTFEFYQDSINVAAFPPDTVRIETRYVLTAASVAEVADSTVQLYDLTRSVRMQGPSGWSAWTTDGQSPSQLSYFEIELLNRDGQTVATESATSYIRVAFSLVPPYQSSKQYLREVNWGTTIAIRPF